MADEQGAIDNEYDDSRRTFDADVDRELDGVQTAPMPGGVALDLVTRQPLFIRQVVADDLAEYYEAEGFNLLTYKTHPYLPVRKTDRVFECVFIPGTADGAHKPGKTYDYPEGRLLHLPVEQAWGDE